MEPMQPYQEQMQLNGRIQVPPSQPNISFVPIENATAVHPNTMLSEVQAPGPTGPQFASVPSLQLSQGPLIHPTPVRPLIPSQPSQMNPCNHKLSLSNMHPPAMPATQLAPQSQQQTSSGAFGPQPIGHLPHQQSPVISATGSAAPAHRSHGPLPPPTMPMAGSVAPGPPPPPVMPAARSVAPGPPPPPVMPAARSVAPGPPPMMSAASSVAPGPPPPPVMPAAGSVAPGPPPPVMPAAGSVAPGPPPPPVMSAAGSVAPGSRSLGPLLPPPVPPMSVAARPSFVPAPPAPMPFVAPAPPLPVGPPPRQMISPPPLTQQQPPMQSNYRENSVNLLRDRQLLNPYSSEPMETAAPPPLGHPFPADANCDPDVMSCTMNAVPATSELLRRSRLPLGLVLHPFKDLRSLPIIQANIIVRCQACRAYINPYVRFSSQRRWRCSLCFINNDLPDEFLYDPVSKSYGDPSRRPEIRNGTVEFVATQEYSVRPPPPATYIVALDVSQILSPDPGASKAAAAYISTVCRTLLHCLDRLPGDARTQLAVITFNGILHLYRLDGARPKLLAMPDLDGDASLPTPDGLLVPVAECREAIVELLETLPEIEFPRVPGCCLGSALATALRLAQSSGGRLLVFLASRPSVGPGALDARPSSDADQSAGQPATDHYKRLALDCCSAQLSIDLFCIGSAYLDLASVMPAAVYSSGTVHRYARMPQQADQLAADLGRHLTRKLGLEAVLRVRCSNGYSVAAFYGSCFVRATDLAALPCASPDAGFAVQLAVGDGAGTAATGGGASEPVVFQTALLYTGRKGDRRIRVHTLALPVATRIEDVFASADQRAIVGLLSQIGAERVLTGASRLPDARDALVNAAADPLAAFARATGQRGAGGLWSPNGIRLLPLLVLALLKWPAFRPDVQQPDERAAALAELRTSPLRRLLQQLLPSLYALHLWSAPAESDSSQPPSSPPRLQPSASQMEPGGAYLLDAGQVIFLALPASAEATQLASRARAFADRLRADRLGEVPLISLRLTGSPSSAAPLTPYLIEDRTDSSMSYLEFLQYLQKHVLG